MRIEYIGRPKFQYVWMPKYRFTAYAYTHKYFKYININITDLGTDLIIYFFGLLIVIDFN